MLYRYSAVVLNLFRTVNQNFRGKSTGTHMVLHLPDYKEFIRNITLLKIINIIVLQSVGNFRDL